MSKRFNTAGLCRPARHYMVDMSHRLAEVREMVENGDYFVINRARQYGKTTLLHLLKGHLSDSYAVFSISFEGIEREVYAGTASFCRRFCRLLYNVFRYGTIEGISDSCRRSLEQAKEKEMDLADLSDLISDLCSQADRTVVLMIDEVDQASNYEIFLTFLGMLRSKYLSREEIPTFQSVILAGVYDIKNLKLKMRPEAEHQYNSPWNVAVEFLVDMSFSVEDIAGMLTEYEQEHHTGMDVWEIARLLYEYTSGYPFFVSRLCQLMGELPSKKYVWTKDGVLEAVKRLVSEPNMLFDDMVKKLDDFPELKKMLYRILFQGQRIPYSVDQHFIEIGQMFGLAKNVNETVVITNRIFEMRLYNLFLSEEIVNSRIYAAADLEKNRFIQNGHLNMELVLERFVEAFTDIYSDAKEDFLEENGRRFFLLYLKPIINGVGNYYIEARTRDQRRTDMIVDYRGEQYVCELKIWRGEENRRGEQQLLGYLDDYHLTTGYLISFCFNQKKQVGVKRQQLGGRTIIEAIV